jgi:hypothetical protein
MRRERLRLRCRGLHAGSALAAGTLTGCPPHTCSCGTQASHLGTPPPTLPMATRPQPAR